MELKFTQVKSKNDSDWEKIGGGWDKRKDGKAVASGKGISFKIDKGVDIHLKGGDSLMVFTNDNVSKGQPSHRLSVNTAPEKK